MAGATSVGKRQEVSTRYVRVARVDWPLVKMGVKREFRVTGYIPTLLPTLFPVPIIAFCLLGPRREPDSRLMVCERVWIERLGEISAESLAREGFEHRRQFIDYWRKQRNLNTHTFRPLQLVAVYQVRPWAADDIEVCGTRLIEHLYGEHLEAD